MKYTKRIAALLLSAVLVLGMLAGCGKQDDEMALRISLPEGEATLDPAMVTTDTEKIVVSHIFENLMKFSNDGEGGVQAVNGLARNYQCEENLDGTETYTFTLRNSVKWSDGRPVTAGDFVYAWQRLVSPDTASPNAELLDMVAGYQDARSSGDVSCLQISAPDEKTLTVVLSHHCSYFVEEICTSPATMPVRSDAVEKENWSMSAGTLVTNGAYCNVQSWQDNTLSVSATEDYYGYRRLGPKTLDFLFFNEPEADFRLGLTADEIKNCPKMWQPDPYPQVTAVVINQMDNNTNNEKLRQAMSLVVDRTALTELLPVGSSRPAEGLIPLGMRSAAGSEFRTVAGPQIDNSPEGYAHSCEMAQELIKGLTMPGINNVTLLYEAIPEIDLVAKELQKTWAEKLHLSVALRPMGAEEMTAALESGDFVAALVQLGSDRNDPVGMLAGWCSGDRRNWANLYSNAYDLLIRVSNNAASSEARDAYLADAEKMLLEDGHMIPLYYGTTTALLRDGLTGLVYDGMGVYHFSSVVKQKN